MTAQSWGTPNVASAWTKQGCALHLLCPLLLIGVTAFGIVGRQFRVESKPSATGHKRSATSAT
jgi:hypothetical protein